jgi:hypothetical protein
MALYVRCAAGACKFRDPAGKLVDDLPDPRKKKGVPADTAPADLKPTQLVYDVVTDGTAKCAGTCRCYIIAQIIDTKAAKVVSEIVRSGDGDDPGGLDKADHDKIVKQNTVAGHREVKFVAACLETELQDGKVVPKI